MVATRSGTDTSTNRTATTRRATQVGRFLMFIRALNSEISSEQQQTLREALTHFKNEEIARERLFRLIPMIVDPSLVIRQLRHADAASSLLAINDLPPVDAPDETEPTQNLNP